MRKKGIKADARDEALVHLSIDGKDGGYIGKGCEWVVQMSCLNLLWLSRWMEWFDV